MKRGVQILLLLAGLLPALAGAREETMEERKRRITRKYLRERVTIAYSERVVPEEQLEDENVLDSEKLKEPQIDLEREGPGQALPPPMPRPPPPSLVENKNWLLSEDSELEDPYADPFALKDSRADAKKPYLWPDWKPGNDASPYAGTPRESRYNWRNDDGSSSRASSSGYNATGPGIFGSRNPYAEGVQPGYPQRDGQSPRAIDSLDLSREKRLNPALEQNRLETPFPIRSPSFRDGYESKPQPRPGTYTPYKSPYQAQREQWEQQRGNYDNPGQEYRRQDPYQEWKRKNQPAYDPMSDDAYIKEVMPRPSR